jgi:uncharacterized membrane protein
MENKQKISTKRIVLAALMAALTVVGSGLRIKLPSPVLGTNAFHLGNIFCALSGILLGPWLGGFAAGMGSFLYDILFFPAYADEAWITFLTKGAYGLVAGLIAWMGKKDCGYVKSILATAAGAVTYAALYLFKSYFYGGILKQGLTHAAAWIVVIEKIPATIFNAAVALIFAPILAVAITKALKRSHLSLR